MTIYILNLVFMLFWGILLLIPSHRKQLKRLYVILISLQLFLIGALRDTTVGVDIPRYVNQFSAMKYYAFSDILNFSKDSGYHIFTKIIYLISSNPHVYLAIISAIFAIGIGIFIYKYSSNYVMSFFLIITLRIYSFSLTGLRQTVAMSIILVFGYKYIIERKPIQFIITVLFASFFHLTALIFFIAYFLAYKKITFTYIAILFVISPFLYIIRKTLVSFFMNTFLSNTTYGSYTIRGDYPSGYETLFLYILIFLIAFIFKSNVLNKNKNNTIWYNMAILGIFFQMFVSVIPEFFRISMYFSMGNAILIPEVVNCIKDKKLVAMGFSIIFILLFTQFVILGPGAEIAPYSFFWQ